MSRYRVVFSIPSASGERVNGVEFVEADTMQGAIIKVSLDHQNIEIHSAGLDRKDPEPVRMPPEVAIEGLAKALVRCNSVLLALLNNPVFASSLTPQRLESLKSVTTDAQLALDAAGVKVTR